MSESRTIRQMSGMSDAPAALQDSTLVMVDLQNTYTQGDLALTGVDAAIDWAAELLERARHLGIPVIHIQHDDGPGSAYDITAPIGQIIDRVAPRPDEIVVVKNYPNSFVATDLESHLKAAGKTHLVLAGFMTHMCISSTARAAFNLEYDVVVAADATATRDLPGVDADTLQRATLAGIADLFGIVTTSADIPD